MTGKKGGQKGPRGNYDKPLSLDMDFGEALERFAQADPEETREETAKGQALRLVQRGDGPPLLIYASDRGPRVEFQFRDEKPWFTVRQMADVFGVDTDTVSDHIKNFLDNGELDLGATTGNFPVVQIEGGREVRREINHFALDVALYVGYRVNSAQGVTFRRYVTDVLIQIAKHGYYIDKERLMQPGRGFGDDLKETIREIRTAPDNAYREVKRIVSMCQDYDGSSKMAQAFYAGMENKMLYVASGRTAPELIAERADPEAPNMGLTFYLGKRGPTQKDSRTGNFYLDVNEQRLKGRAVFMLLDYFEEQYDQGRLVTMKECEEKLNGFIEFNKWPLLRDLGSVSREDANAIADARRAEYYELLAISDAAPSTPKLSPKKK